MDKPIKNRTTDAQDKMLTDTGTTQDLSDVGTLSQYLKSTAGIRQGRSIPPLDQWHPTNTADMDLVIKANGEWWHEGTLMTRQSLVNLFATILWREDHNGQTMYFLKTPVQKLRIQVEDVPLLINDVGIVTEDDVSWLEFTTSTGDVVRLDEVHPIELRAYQPMNRSSLSKPISDSSSPQNEAQMRPYMLVRNGLTALIGRNTFYHLTQIGELTQQDDTTRLSLTSGGKTYMISMTV